MRQWLEAGYFKGDLPISQNPSGNFRALSGIFPNLEVAFQPTVSSTEEEKARIEEDARAESDARAAAEAEAKRKQDEEAEALRRLDEEKALARTEAEAEARRKQEKDDSRRRVEEERAIVEAEARVAAESEARATAAAEAESRARAAAEAEAKRKEEEAAAAALAARKSAEEKGQAPTQAQTQALSQVQVISAEQNAQSAQLKMMLGLSAPVLGQTYTGSTSQDGMVIAGPPQKGDKAKDAGQQQMVQKGVNGQQSVTKKQVLLPAPSAWGGAAAGKSSGRMKSMSEIQQEEARNAARLAREQQAAAPRVSVSVSGSGNVNGSGGWANIAAGGGGSTGWSGFEIRPTSRVVASTTSAARVVTTGPPAAAAMQQVRAKQPVQVAAIQKGTLSQRQGTAQSSADDFGASGKMSPTLENWCKDQMRKISGSDDLTLVS